MDKVLAVGLQLWRCGWCGAALQNPRDVGRLGWAGAGLSGQTGDWRFTVAWREWNISPNATTITNHQDPSRHRPYCADWHLHSHHALSKLIARDTFDTKDVLLGLPQIFVVLILRAVSETWNSSCRALVWLPCSLAASFVRFQIAVAAMEEGSVNYGTPNTGASPGSNPILAQPPLPDSTTTGNNNEGKHQPIAIELTCHCDSNIFLLSHFRRSNGQRA